MLSLKALVLPYNQVPFSCVLFVIINFVPSVILEHSFMTAFILLKVPYFTKIISLTESWMGHLGFLVIKICNFIG